MAIVRDGKAQRILALITTSVLSQWGCSGSMVSSNGQSGEKDTATIDADADSELTISSGNLGGTQIAIPAGALESGSTVSASEVNAPAAFSSNANVSSASSALSVTATDANGNTLDSLTQPMTIQIPLGGSGLALAVEETEDNLCALLAGADNTNYVWRRGSMNIVENKAVFDSTKLGTFQLVYCGAESLDGFSDAKESDVAGAASLVLATVNVPNELQNGADKYCTGIVDYDKATGDGQEVTAEDFISAFTEHKIQTSNYMLELTGKPGLRIDKIDTNKAYLIGVFFQSATDTCSLSSDGGPTGLLLGGKHFGSEFKGQPVDISNIREDWDIGYHSLSAQQAGTAPSQGPELFELKSCADSRNVTGSWVKQSIHFEGVNSSSTGTGGIGGTVAGNHLYFAGSSETDNHLYGEVKFQMGNSCDDDSSNNPEHSMMVTAYESIEPGSSYEIGLFATKIIAGDAIPSGNKRCVVLTSANSQGSTYSELTNSMIAQFHVDQPEGGATAASPVETYLTGNLYYAASTHKFWVSNNDVCDDASYFEEHSSSLPAAGSHDISID